MLGRTQKLLLGLAILLLVNLLWVSSSELIKFIYEDDRYDKPFFYTYFKTSMFSIYLLIIGIIAPWKESCDRQNGNYAMMEQHADEENYYTNQAALSDSTFVPIRVANPGSIPGVLSGAESDDSSVRSVRFCKMAEVREMSAHEATDALMARLSYAASMRIRRQKTHHKTAKTALLFCLLWLAANYFSHLALDMDEEPMITLIRSTAGTVFTLLLAAMFPSAMGDKFTITKVIAVTMSIGGVVVMSISDLHDSKMTRGVLLALFSAFFYASYLVFVKRKSDTEEKVDIPLFLGFVGLWNLLLLWPIFFILHFTRIETFELPSQGQFGLLFLNGFICTVLAVALWLWGCFLTSSMIGTLSLSLQIPLTIAFDVLLKHKPYTPMYGMGSMALIVSLLLVVLLLRNDDSDPLMKLFKVVYRKVCGCHKPSIVRVTDDEQQESLINSSD
ncbi:solute carrier family 35 member F5 [Drosophila grimshawi]|uniref:Solute carrier family 35 member F5 n=1 Tax=Drosophila grimshawi TaxID=7222 RepID=B4J4I0_DROGR|nr:solute carrier family 35 member F5 [Drosophila grimshawi]XP_032591026.1 solute carrier family 35 member F5 [Drosophila grimshawi]XP_032591027.1 solute carrier family 35 member F5 [Drosophila grimshawi]EDW01662.1 GH20331 [Drosophila grimshawi]